MSAPEKQAYDFTQDWFSPHVPLWAQIVPLLPERKKFLEIGSFEGLSACWMLDNALSEDGELYCVDTWQGSPEFWMMPKDTVVGMFGRFTANISLAKKDTQKVFTLCDLSVNALSRLIAEKHSGTFDLIYVDGAHEARNVMTDACLSWALLRPGGFLIFDDYIWDLDEPVLNRPKVAIEAFAMLFHDELIHQSIGTQYVVQKRTA